MFAFGRKTKFERNDEQQTVKLSHGMDHVYPFKKKIQRKIIGFILSLC